VSDAELDRLREEYAARDVAAESPYRWDNAAYVRYMQRLERALLRSFGDAGVELRSASVLDVGCGTGYFLHRLREYGAGECHGIDLVENRIATARDRYPTLEWHVGSAAQLPFSNGEFDLVTQFTCLSSIVDAETRTAVAQEMRRVARGWLLSVDMRSDSKGDTPTVGLDREELRRLFGDPVLVRGFRGMGSLTPFRSHYVAIWR
jgi:SAM-dependent methyltransferase